MKLRRMNHLKRICPIENLQQGLDEGLVRQEIICYKKSRELWLPVGRP